MLIDGLNGFSLDFGIIKSITKSILAQTDQLEVESPSVYQDYGLESESFMFYLTEQLVLMIPLFCFFAFCWCLATIGLAYTKNKFLARVTSFCSHALVFNYPIRFFIQLSLDLFIIAFF